jgi:hypothetical protein
VENGIKCTSVCVTQTHTKIFSVDRLFDGTEKVNILDARSVSITRLGRLQYAYCSLAFQQ